MLTSCQSSVNNENVNKAKQTVEYNDGAYNGDIIKDESAAKEYADFIMRNTLKQNIKDYNVIDISPDDSHNLWIVHYSVDELTLGGDVRIEISKKDGRVNKILFGE